MQLNIIPPVLAPPQFGCVLPFMSSNIRSSLEADGDSQLVGFTFDSGPVDGSSDPCDLKLEAIIRLPPLVFDMDYDDWPDLIDNTITAADWVVILGKLSSADWDTFPITGDGGDGGPAANAQLNSPRDIAFGSNGELYLSDNGKLRVISPRGIISTVELQPAEGGDTIANPPALRNPTLLTYDPQLRRLYLGESDRVRYLDEDGVLHRFAGGGKETIAGAGEHAGPAVDARLGFVRDIAAGTDGSVYISQMQPARILRVNEKGRIQSFFEAENAVPVDRGGNVLWIESIVGLAFEPGGRLYFTDQVGGHIYALDPDGSLVLITPTVEGRARGPLYFPTTLALTAQGDLYVSQFSLGVVTRLREGDFGEVVVGSLMRQGDGGPATEARLFSPSDVAFDAAGNLYIADRDNAVVRSVSPEGRIETYAGSGYRHPDFEYAGHNSTDVALGFVFQVDTDADGVYALGNYVARAIRPDRSVQSLFSLTSDNKRARLTGFLAAGSGVYYVSVAERRQIWRYDSKAKRGALIAGSGERGYAVNGPAKDSPLLAPMDMALDGDGNLYFIDGTRDIHRVSPDGGLTTIAAHPRKDEEGRPVTVAEVTTEYPRALAWGPDSCLYFGQTADLSRICWSGDGSARLEPVGGAAPGFGGDGGPALEARFDRPHGMAFDGQGRLFVADRNNHRVRVLTPLPPPQ